MPYGPASSEGRPNRAVRAALAFPGALSSLAGFLLPVGGSLSPEGSAFDGSAGLGPIISGFLRSLRHRARRWALVIAGAIGWPLRNMPGGSGPAHRTVKSADAGGQPAGTPDALLDPASEHPSKMPSAMMPDWQTGLWASDHYTARILPPETVGETGWDILLALHSDRDFRLGFQRLASMVSVPHEILDRRLGALEERRLITGTRDPSTDELLAVLTETGRGLLDRYFSATKDLQAGVHS